MNHGDVIGGSRSRQAIELDPPAAPEFVVDWREMSWSCRTSRMLGRRAY